MRSVHSRASLEWEHTMSSQEKKIMEDDIIASFREQLDGVNHSVEEIASKMMKQGLTGKDAAEMSPKMLENIYSQAYRLYNTGKYVEASHLFRILILMNGMEPKYMLGFAACFHMLKDYQNAVQFYTLCSAIDPVSPLPHYHASDCFIQMKDYISAMIALEMTLERAKDQKKFAELKERSLLSLESLKKQLMSSKS